MCAYIHYYFHSKNTICLYMLNKFKVWALLVLGLSFFFKKFGAEMAFVFKSVETMRPDSPLNFPGVFQLLSNVALHFSQTA